MRRRISRVAFLASLPLFLLGAQSPPSWSGPVRNAEQGWTETQRNLWYSINQGSRLMPLSWMRALEQPGNSRPFLAPDHIAGFRYIPDWSGAGATGLPLGFAVEDRGDRHLVRTRLRWYAGQRDLEPWVGLTCSACHTGEIAHGGQRLRVDGAPAMADFQRFVEAVDQALIAARDDGAKWDRFARAVLSTNDTPGNRLLLRGALDRLIADEQQIARLNGNPIRYGFFRLDAFGHIYNKTVILSGAAQPTGNPSNAPVSYPFLWNVPQHDFVQWNGSAVNKWLQLGRGRLDIGAVGRNAGEVIGVFGDVVVRPRRRSNYQLFPSSINANNLVVVEQELLNVLLPPAWPEDMLGRIDRASAARGALLFDQQCSGCHAPLGRTDLTTPVYAHMGWFAYDAPPPRPGSNNVPPGTDPLMACNGFYYSAASGLLRGYSTGGHTIGERDQIINLLTLVVTNSLVGKWRQLLIVAGEIFLGIEPRPLAEAAPEPPSGPAPSAVPVRAAQSASDDLYPGLPQRYRQCVDRAWGGDDDRILGYKARPLTGIWATAPFLHNGSVPTLYDLLLPPGDRPSRFFVGTRQFDPVRVGYVTTPSADNSFEFRARDAQGNVIWGNFNGGHDYGNAGLSDRQRRDLVEYLKTL